MNLQTTIITFIILACAVAGYVYYVLPSVKEPIKTILGILLGVVCFLYILVLMGFIKV